MFHLITGIPVSLVAHWLRAWGELTHLHLHWDTDWLESICFYVVSRGDSIH